MAQPRQLKLFVLGSFAIGLLCALALPAVHIGSAGVLDGSGSMDLSLVNTVKLMHEAGYVWIPVVAAIGVVVAGLGAWTYDDAQPEGSTWWITLGVLGALTMPLSLLVAISSLPVETSVFVSVSLGPGLLVAMIAFIILAALPWYARSQSQRLMAGTPQGTQWRAQIRPAWLTRQDEETGSPPGIPWRHDDTRS